MGSAGVECRPDSGYAWSNVDVDQANKVTWKKLSYLG